MTMILRHQKQPHQLPQFQKLLLSTMRTTGTTRRPKNVKRNPNDGDHHHSVKYTGGIMVGIWTTICGIGSAINMARD